MPTPRKIPDELWAEIEELLPPRPSREKGGRPPVEDRHLLDAMLYVLWTGIPWRAMPEKFGKWQTVYDRFAEWRRAGVFEDIWRRCLHLYDAKHGIGFDWQAADGTYVRSPLGGKRERSKPDRSSQTRDERPPSGGSARRAALGAGHGGKRQRRAQAR